MEKQKIEFTYLDNTYTMQLSPLEYEVFNNALLVNHGKADVIALALEVLMSDGSCTRHHKTKISEVLNKSRRLNFRLIC